MQKLAQARSANWGGLFGESVVLGAPTGFEKLWEEVNRGKSVVMVNSKGEVERVVSVVALRIQRDDGRFLVQLGKQDQDSDVVVPSCQMPGGKQERNELTGDTVRRILRQKLEPLATAAGEVLKSDRQVEWKQSKEYKVPTKYYRTVCTTRLRHTPDDLRKVPMAHQPTSVRRSVPGRASFTSVQSKISRTSIRSSELILEMSTLELAILSQAVYAIPADRQVAFYSWLTPGEFEILSKGPNGEALLLTWLQALHPDGVDEDGSQMSRSRRSSLGSSQEMPLPDDGQSSEEGDVLAV
jgi:hypothetical protein